MVNDVFPLRPTIYWFGGMRRNFDNHIEVFGAQAPWAQQPTSGA